MLFRSYKNRGHIISFEDCEADKKSLVQAIYTGKGSVNKYNRTARCKLTFEDTMSGQEFDAFFYNQPYLKDTLKEGHIYLLYGSFKQNSKKLALIAPQIERLEVSEYLTEGMYPVYPLSVKSGIKQKEFYSWIKKALASFEFVEKMPFWIMTDLDLKGINESLRSIHCPENEIDAFMGMRYFKTEKFLSFFSILENNLKSVRKPGIMMDTSYSEKFISALPFILTDSQQKAVDEINEDLSGGFKMNRLLQGDVGSGKTAVAMACAYTVASNGYQCAFLAPTEILAKQHFDRYHGMLAELGLKSVVIYSSMKKSERSRIDDAVACGEIDIIFGTHALFSRQTNYRRLGLVVIDEQHRFGVAQRAELENKGDNPHILVMSATPIPRTLSLSIYKDLSLSILDTKPAGRLPVKTMIINSMQTKNAYDSIKRAYVNHGLKSYIVCPAIDSEDLENVNEILKEAREELYPVKVLYLTGEMKDTEKQAVMGQFSDGEAGVLVSTTVVEVGVDVEDAAIMWIKNADRFGLAQLHQLRGRVGRNDVQCYCFLQTDSMDEKTMKRLAILKNSDDGFEIAREDLKIRGAGEIYGVKQSGKNDGILDDAIEYNDLFMACDGINDILKRSDMEKDKSYYEYLKNQGDISVKGIAFN